MDAESRNWVVVSPLFPPQPGGLADHTERLAAELGAWAKVTVLTSAGPAAESGRFAVRPAMRDWRDAQALKAALEEASTEGPILWQYVPHMYGRGGVNSAVPAVMAALRACGRRQAVIAHEIAAPFSPWPQRFWYALAHRGQWRQVLRHADRVGISTEAWLEAQRSHTPEFRDKLCLVPSPATIPVASLEEGFAGRWRASRGWPAELPVLGCLGSLCASERFAWVRTAWQQAQQPGRPVGLVTAGQPPAPGQLSGQEPLACSLGYAPAAEVSRALQMTDVLLLPFLDGASERRTTFMAGLSHGRAIVTTLGHNTGPTLRRADFFRAVDARQEKGFAAVVAELLADGPQRARLGEAGRQAYARDYDWPKVAARVADLLRGTPAP